jgi:hypothetical protein
MTTCTRLTITMAAVILGGCAELEHHCEISGCTDEVDFERMDVHHLTALGSGGSDHTDNTVALCPACHSRVHRGIMNVKAALEKKLLEIRKRRARRSKTPKHRAR